MKKYSIHFTDDGLADVKALPKNVRNSLKKKLPELLRTDPAGCSDGLNPPLGKYRSCHIGEYRVVFYLAGELRAIAMVGIGKHSAQARKDVYKRLESLVLKGKLAEKILNTLRGFTRPS